jgi:uncharacterized protein (TIGR03435 family)
MKILIPVLVALASPALQGQNPPMLSFEAASVHLSEPGLPTANFHTSPGYLSTHNVTLRDCIEGAYGLKPLQISGPVWLSDLRLDITARAEDRNADDDKLRLMLQTLLADRLGLKTHREEKEQQTYTLTVAKNGPRFHAKGAGDASTFTESVGDGSSGFSEDKTGALAERVSMAEVANKLSQLLDRIVTDETGLKSRYDFRLDLTPYMSTDGGSGKADMMSLIFAGLNDQLGLKLEPGKETADLLVIDSVNRTPAVN